MGLSAKHDFSGLTELNCGWGRSLNGPRAFEAAARHESFIRAAEELCVTQGAVSHQVKGLVAELGVKFFDPSRNAW